MIHSDSLMHYGVLGMRWGIRKDRSAGTALSGKRRKATSSLTKTADSSTSQPGRQTANADSSASSAKTSKAGFKLSEGQKKALKVGAVIAGSAVLAYGGYKVGTQLAVNKKAMQILADNQVIRKTIMPKKALNDMSLGQRINFKAERKASDIRNGADPKGAAKYEKFVRKNAQKAVKQERRDFVKNITTKSDKEVSDFVKRLSEEKKAKDLTNELVDPGRTFTKSVVKTAGRKVMPAVATAAATSAIGYAVNRATADNRNDKAEESARRKKAIRDTATDTRKLVTKK